MLWWLVGLWLLSPALFPIFWLFGMLTSSSRSEINEPSDAKTPGAITTFAESAWPMASYRAHGSRAPRPFVNSRSSIPLPRMSAAAGEHADQPRRQPFARSYWH